MKRKKKKAPRRINVKKLTEMAGLAIKHEFYLEASWILSDMFERKLKRILGKLENPPGPGFTLEQSIKRVKFLHLSTRNPDLTSHVEVGLIDGIRNWKNQRNDIFKDIPEVHVSHARLKRLAVEGTRLYRELNQAYKSLRTGKMLLTAETGADT